MAHIASSDLVPGRVLQGIVRGKPRFLFPGHGDATAARLKFGVFVRLDSPPSDYSAPVPDNNDNESGLSHIPKPQTGYTIIFTLTSAPGQPVDTARAKDDYKKLSAAQKHKGLIEIDCTGVKVVSREYDKEKKDRINVAVCASGPRRAVIEGVDRILLDCATSAPNPRRADSKTKASSSKAHVWDFHDDVFSPGPSSPHPPAQPPAVAEAPPVALPPRFRPLSTLPQLSFSAGAAPITPQAPRYSRNKRPGAPVSAVPHNHNTTSTASASTTLNKGLQTSPPPPTRERFDLSHLSQPAIAPLDIVHRARQFLPTPSDASRPETIEVDSSGETEALVLSPPSSSDPVVLSRPSSVSRSASSPINWALDNPGQPQDLETSLDIDIANEPTPPPPAPSMQNKRAREDSVSRDESLSPESKRIMAKVKRRKQLNDMLEAEERRGAELQSRQSRNSVTPAQRVSIAPAAATPSQGRERVKQRTESSENRQAHAGVARLPEAPDRTVTTARAAPLSRVEAQKQAMATAQAAAEAKARDAAKKKAAEEATNAQMLGHELRAGGNTYALLRDVRDGVLVNIMGVIIRVTAGHVPGMDHIHTVVISDLSVHTAGVSSEDMVVTVFRKTPQELVGFDVGAAVLFRGVKTNKFRDKVKGNLYSNSSNQWATLRGHEIKYSVDWKGARLLPEEHERLRALSGWWNKQDDASHFAAVSTQVGDGGVGTTKKEHLLEALDASMFADIVIVAVIKNDRGYTFPRWELYLTDGSVNPRPTRNFHNVSAGLPGSAIFMLAVWARDGADGDTRDFQPYEYYRFPNVRCKDRHGELELNWSEKVETTQKAAGWKNKEFTRITKEDPRAKAIERRIEQTKQKAKRGEDFPVAVAPPPDFFEQLPSAPPPETRAPIRTTNREEIKHPVTPLSEAIANPTLPNKYRIQARVSRIESRRAKAAPDSLAILFCSKCRTCINAEHCQSCNDRAYQYAEARWDMFVFFEMDDVAKATAAKMGLALAFEGEWGVFFGGPAAEACLPALPPLGGYMGPNEVKRVRNRLEAFTGRVHDAMLGPKLDGERTRPAIDWTVQTYTVGEGANKTEMWEVVDMEKA